MTRLAKLKASTQEDVSKLLWALGCRCCLQELRLLGFLWRFLGPGAPSSGVFDNMSFVGEAQTLPCKARGQGDQKKQYIAAKEAATGAVVAVLEGAVLLLLVVVVVVVVVVVDVLVVIVIVGVMVVVVLLLW